MYPRNKYWKPLVRFLHEKKLEKRIFIGPEVLLYEFPKVFPYQILKDIDLDDYDFEYIVFHKKLPEDLTNDFLDLIEKSYKPVWGNHLFVVYKKNRSKIEKLKSLKHIFWTNVNLKKYRKPVLPEKQGILITTYNRPQYLKRLLDQLKNRTEEILVINDGSDERFIEDYESIKKNYPSVSFIDNIKNMGLVFSLNTGFSYFLADPGVEWIHYIQDDVILKENFFETLDRLKDKKQRPVLAGIYREPHKIFEKKEIKGIQVYMLRSAPAQHLLFHRQYLQNNLPIPNPYVGAPKADRGKPGQGADEDWWLLSWSPNSIVKKGKFVVAVPGLCYTDAFGDESTWDFESK